MLEILLLPLVFVILKGVTEFFRGRTEGGINGIGSDRYHGGSEGNVKSYCRFHDI
jgi:hypothetical protein